MPSQTSLVFEVRGIDSNGVMNAVVVKLLLSGLKRKNTANKSIILARKAFYVKS